MAKLHKIMIVRKRVLALRKGQTYLPEALARVFFFQNIEHSHFMLLRPPFGVQDGFKQRGPKSRVGPNCVTEYVTKCATECVTDGGIKSVLKCSSYFVII